MAYLALARKYRPKTFQEVLGQSDTVRALSNALKEDHLHHAYLFAGTRGCGKTTLARIFAKCLNCQQKISSTAYEQCKSCEFFQACEQCKSCEFFQASNHPDFYEIDAASRTGVDAMRELLEEVHYSPSAGMRFKVYLIDEVHMLSRSAFNALLKTLEEPPGHVKFLFATTVPKGIPPTVLSRCLQFYLRNIEPNIIVEQLRSILDKEKVGFDEESLKVLSDAARGSLRDALSLTDQAISHGGGSISADNVKHMLGIVHADEVVEVLKFLAQDNQKHALDYVDQLYKQATNFEDLLLRLQQAIHELALAPITGRARTDQYKSFIGKFSPEWLQNAYQILTIGMRDLKYAPNHRVGFEMTLLRVFEFEPLPEIVEKLSSPRSVPVRRNTNNPPREQSKEARSESSNSPAPRPAKREQFSSTPKKPTPKPQADLNEEKQNTASMSFKSNRDAEAQVVRSDPLVTSLIDNFDATIVDIKRI